MTDQLLTQRWQGYALDMRYWRHGTAHAVRNDARWCSHRFRDGRKRVAVDRARSELAVRAELARMDPGERVVRLAGRELDLRPVERALYQAFSTAWTGI